MLKMREYGKCNFTYAWKVAKITDLKILIYDMLYKYTLLVLWPIIKYKVYLFNMWVFIRIKDFLVTCYINNKLIYFVYI